MQALHHDKLAIHPDIIEINYKLTIVSNTYTTNPTRKVMADAANRTRYPDCNQNLK